MYIYGDNAMNRDMSFNFGQVSLVFLCVMIMHYVFKSVMPYCVYEGHKDISRDICIPLPWCKLCD
jgi:hypothetical protein